MGVLYVENLNLFVFLECLLNAVLEKAVFDLGGNVLAVALLNDGLGGFPGAESRNFSLGHKGFNDLVALLGNGLGGDFDTEGGDTIFFFLQADIHDCVNIWAFRGGEKLVSKCGEVKGGKRDFFSLGFRADVLRMIGH